MQTYEIYYVSTGCDADWQLLETIQANAMEEVQDNVIQRYPMYVENLVIASAYEAVIAQINESRG